MRPRHPIEGNHLVLRELDDSHAGEPYLGWLRDTEVTRYLEARFTSYDRERLAAYIRAENERANAVLFGIFRKPQGRLIGTIKLSQIRPEHRHCVVGLMIGDKSAWGRGYGTEAILMACGYAFETLRLHKVGAGCYSNNSASVRAFEKAGFRLEGRLPEDRMSEQGWIDKLWLGLINPAERRPAMNGQG
jgi:RimJ/RimL family protein N-acetyltransferase